MGRHWISQGIMIPIIIKTNEQGELQHECKRRRIGTEVVIWDLSVMARWRRIQPRVQMPDSFTEFRNGHCHPLSYHPSYGLDKLIKQFQERGNLDERQVDWQKDRSVLQEDQSQDGGMQRDLASTRVLSQGDYISIFQNYIALFLRIAYFTRQTENKWRIWIAVLLLALCLPDRDASTEGKATSALDSEEYIRSTRRRTLIAYQ